MSKTAQLEQLGFIVKHEPFTSNFRISCDSCQALAINGTPTHEFGCPNTMYLVECFDCGFAFHSSRNHRGQRCEDCLNPQYFDEEEE